MMCIILSNSRKAPFLKVFFSCLMNIVKKIENKKKINHERFKVLLNKLIKSSRLTVAQLSKETGVSIHTINALKTKDNFNPTLSTLISLSEYFNLSIDILLGNEPLPEKYCFGEFTRSLEVEIPLFSSEAITSLTCSEFLNLLDEQSYTETYPASPIYDKNENFSVLLGPDLALKLSSTGSIFVKPNTVFIFSRNVEPSHHDIVLASVGKNSILAFRYVFKEGDKTYYSTIDFGFTKIPPSSEKHIIIGTMVQTDLGWKRT